MLQQRAAAAAEPEDEVYLGLPHRLDRPVSGVILLAKTRRAARILSRQFERRQVRKLYWACAEGFVEPAEATWTDFLRKVPGQPRAEIVAADSPAARRAVLHYRRLDSIALATTSSEPATHGSWLEIRLETGRMHQVRLQAAARGHPLLGDAQYGARTLFGRQSADPREQAIALHARSLTFRHPETQTEMTIVAPIGQAWIEAGIPPDGQTGSGVDFAIAPARSTHHANGEIDSRPL